MITPDDISKITAAVSNGVDATAKPAKVFLQRARDMGVIKCTDEEAKEIIKLAEPLINALVNTVVMQDSQISQLMAKRIT